MTKKQRESEIRRELREDNICVRGIVTVLVSDCFRVQNGRGKHYKNYTIINLNYLPHKFTNHYEMSNRDHVVSLLLGAEEIEPLHRTERTIVQALVSEGYQVTGRRADTDATKNMITMTFRSGVERRAILIADPL